MKKLTVISGKGGTGKTTVSSNLAALAGDLVLADCDVDAPNMHLLLKPEVISEDVFKGGKIAIKDEDKCIDCGLCVEACNFGAISPDIKVDSIKCEGCGVCVEICPTDSFKLIEEETGYLYQSKCMYGPMVHAKLKVGAENSGKLVTEVREKAEKIAKKQGKKLVLIDGSPGIGCPVIASLNGVDATLIVTEPTRSGLSDLKRVFDVIKHFGIKAMVAINKYDLNEDITGDIEEFCKGEKIPVVGKIPFDQLVVDVLRQGKLLVNNNSDSRPSRAINEIWSNIKDLMEL